MKHFLKVFISSVAAGILIGVGGYVFLSSKAANIFMASFLFSLGLITIISFKLYLFTGKVGYIFENKVKFLLDLAVCWAGNLLGAVITGYLLRLTRNDLTTVAQNVVDLKINDNLGSIFILSMFCGMMIFIAVEIQKKEIPGVFKLIGIVLPIMVFIVCGFEHCVANMFYFSYANAWSWKVLLYLIVMSLGNSAGSLILWTLNYFSIEKKKEEI